MLCDCDCDCDTGCSTCNATCDVPCDTCQGACQSAGGGQLASDQGMSYSFGSWNRDDIIIKQMSRAVYNQMGQAIQTMAAYRGPSGRNGTIRNVNSGGWTWDPETRDFIYAEKTNDLIEGANSLGGGTTVSGVPTLARDTNIVYAAYFNAIANAINTMKLNPLVCITCNTTCDVQCNGCNICLQCYTCLVEGGSGCDCDCDCN